MQLRRSLLLPLTGASLALFAPAHAQLRPPQVPALVTLKDTSYPVPPTGAFYVAPNGSSSNTGTIGSPWSVAKALSSTGAPTGSTLVFRGGDYRNVHNLAITRRLTLQAFPGEKPWLKGSVVVTGWAQEGSLWVKTGWTYGFPVNAGPENIDPDFPLSSARDMVFVNNLALVQVGSKDAVVAGTFFVDYGADKLYIGDNPQSKIVEATAFSTPFDLTSDVQQIVVRGLGFTHFADWGIKTNRNHRSVIEDNTFAWNGDGGVQVFLADDVTLRGNTVSCNGQNGLFGFYSDRLIAENNTFAYNNVERYKLSWGGCALKLGYNTGTVFRDNLVEHNNGTGIWFDTSNLRCNVVGNISRHNAAFGIFMELNHNCIVAFNVCYDNSRGIVLSDSSAIRVYNNTLSRNGRALSVFDSHRVNDPNDGQEFYGETAAAFNEGITWVSRDNVFKNNIYSNTRSADGLLLDALDAETGASSSRQIAASDFNAYYRASSGMPSKVVRWRGGTWWNPVDYATLVAFRSANPAYEANSLAIDNQPDPFFVGEASQDFRLRAGSPALDRGEALPLDIAQATGRPQSPVHLGALGRAAISLYRLEATNGVQHFLTASQAENDFLVSSGAWLSIGPVGFVHVSQSEAPGLVPLFRLFSPQSGGHFYTSNPAERDAALASGYYVYEGVAGWVFNTAAPDRKPLLRAYNPQTAQHLFTGSASLYNGLPAPWIREGVACYLRNEP